MRRLRALALGMIGAAAGLLFYTGSFFIRSYLENEQARKASESLKETYTNFADEDPEDSDFPAGVQETEKASKPSRSPGKKEEIRESFGICWKELREVNPQIAGWIEIPNADISYPVVHGEDNTYYLSHSFEGEEDPFGTVFLDWRNKKKFQDSHSFLYGHNMEGNLMFANLNRYVDAGYFQQCPEIYLYTPEKKYRYQIFSVEQAEEGSESFSYGQRLGSREFLELLVYLEERSIYDTGVIPEISSPILTLVTCNSHLDEWVRMLVHGTRVEEWGIETD